MLVRSRSAAFMIATGPGEDEPRSQVENYPAVVLMSNHHQTVALAGLLLVSDPRFS